MNPQFKKRLVFCGVVIMLLIALAGIISILKKTASETLYLNDTGTSLRHSVSASKQDGDLLINTNRNFVRYTPSSGKATTLMNDGLLPEITNVSWSPDENSALFQASTLSNADVLGADFEPGQAKTGPSWWLADFKTKTYKSLNFKALDAGWANDSSVYFIGNPLYKNEFGLYTMNLSTNTTSLVLEDRNMLNAKATADGFAVYLSINKLGTLEKINKTGGNAKIIIKNLSLAPQFNKSGSLAVALVNTSGKIPEDADFVAGTLVLIDVKNGKLAKTLAKKQTILGAWSDLDATYYFKSSQNKQITRMSTEDTTVKSTNIRTVSKNSPQISTFIGQGTNLYALGSANRLYSAGTNLENNVTTSKNDMVNGSKGIHEDGYSIYYYSSSNTYAISLESVLTDNSKQRALGKLQNLGINTSLQDIVYDNEYAALKGDAN